MVISPISSEIEKINYLKEGHISMAKIKILLSSRPKLISDVMRKMINDQDDMEIIGEIADPLQLLILAKNTEADAMIITPITPNGEPKICRQLLYEHPKLVIMTMDADTKIAYVYRVNFPRVCIKAPSSQTIQTVLRGGWPPTDLDECTPKNKTS